MFCSCRRFEAVAVEKAAAMQLARIRNLTILAMFEFGFVVELDGSY
jgi:hypothetical protein